MSNTFQPQQSHTARYSPLMYFEYPSLILGHQPRPCLSTVALFWGNCFHSLHDPLQYIPFLQISGPSFGTTDSCLPEILYENQSTLFPGTFLTPVSSIRGRVDSVNKDILIP